MRHRVKVLWDNDLMDIGYTHKTISVFKIIEFPEGVPQEIGPMPRTKRRSDIEDGERYATWLSKAVYLPGFLELIDHGRIELYRSFGLILEIMNQPGYRVDGKKSIFDWGLWGERVENAKQIDEEYGEFRMEVIDPEKARNFEGMVIDSTTKVSEVEEMTGIRISPSKKNWIKSLKDRRQSDSEFDMLVSYIGKRHDQDIYHILLGERNGMDVFLTNDGKIANAIRDKLDQNPSEKHRKANEFLRDMRIKVMGLKELGEYAGIVPVSEDELYKYAESRSNFEKFEMSDDEYEK